MSSIPHGGQLVNLLVSREQAAELVREAAGLRSIQLSAREYSDVEMLSIGAFSPLTGFMAKADYEASRDNMRLANGLPWGIPITLSVGQGEVAEGDRVALNSPDGTLAAILTVSEVFPYDKKLEASSVFRTEEEAHPGVAALYAQKELLAGGTIQLVNPPDHENFSSYRLTPADTRKSFDDRGWKTIVGFQTRNPVHRAHEYLLKCALEIVDGLLLHPLVGETKSDDIPADVRMKCYNVLLENYFPQNRVLLSVMPAAMRYGGPREAILHSLIRKNYGCTHFIVGRDHAGVGSYYGSYDAQEIFDGYEPGEIGITLLKFEHSFWCNRCEGMGSTKTCPHGAEDRVSLSGTKVREMLTNGERPPMEFSRPEVADILIDAAQPTA
ncbi:MAG: sulfate adenylyltransferase [Armatimonadota bacterium]